MRFAALDGWRGLAAVCVAIYHLPIASHAVQFAPLANFGLFVDLFFVLSGFVVAHAYASRIRDGADAASFMIRRFGRLYPLHLATLLFMLALETAKFAAIAATGLSAGEAAFTGTASPESFLANLFLAQAIGGLDYFSWNRPSWSVSVEFYAYVVFLLVAFTAARFRAHAAAMVVAVALFAFLTIENDPNSHTLHSAFARCCLGFFLGMMTQEALPRGIALPKRWADIAETALAVGLVPLLLFAIGPWKIVSHVYFAALIAIFAAERGYLSRLLSRPGPQRIGDLSYTIYMIHVPIFAVVMAGVRVLQQVLDVELTRIVMLGPARTEHIVWGGTWFLDLVAIVLMAATIAAAFPIYDRFERPMRDWFNARSKAWAPSFRARIVGTN
jgi:peptidoglycan/LPS O-acetylase OafA/YrhL